MPMSAFRAFLVSGAVSAMLPHAVSAEPPGSARLDEVRQRREAEIKASCREHLVRYGAPIFVRIVKETHALELWMETSAGGPFRLYKTFTVANWGGNRLGPKQEEGDGMAPEGFYSVDAGKMNPNSHFHLSFNIGYPNGFDRSLNRTGTFIMVHGSDVSIGCFAMTDAVVEEIYLLADAALRGGQAMFPVHVFPFEMTDARLRKAAGSEWHGFWKQLQAGWRAFEQTRRPPAISVPQPGVYAVKVDPVRRR